MKQMLYLLLAVSCCAGSSLQSMMEELKKLPRELKHTIGLLTLESTLGYQFSLEKQVDIVKDPLGPSFSPDRTRLVTGSGTQAEFEKDVYLFESMTGKKLQTFKGHEQAIFASEFSPDGKTILTGSKDKTARLWDAETGIELQVFKGHTSSILSVAVSPDGNFILTGSLDSTARLWDAETGIELQVFKGHMGSILSVAMSPDGNFVLTGSVDSTARLWNTRTGEQLQLLKGHTDVVCSVAFSPDGKTALTGSYDGTARIWDIHTGEQLQLFTGHIRGAHSVTYSPDSTTVLTASFGGTAYLWDSTTGKKLTELILKEPIMLAVFSADGNAIFTLSSEGTVSLFTRRLSEGEWTHTRKEAAFEAFREKLAGAYQ